MLSIHGPFWQWLLLAASIGAGIALYDAARSELSAWRSRRKPWTIEIYEQLDGGTRIVYPQTMRPDERKVIEAAVERATRRVGETRQRRP